MINRDYHKFRKQRDISFTRAYESKGTGWKTVIYPKSAPKRNQLAREINPLRTAQLSPIYREKN